SAFPEQRRGHSPDIRLKRYLLDTGIAGDYLNRRGSAYARARHAVAEGSRVGLCAPVLGELWDGVFYSTTRGLNEALLKRHLGHFALWPSVNALLSPKMETCGTCPA